MQKFYQFEIFSLCNDFILNARTIFKDHLLKLYNRNVGHSNILEIISEKEVNMHLKHRIVLMLVLFLHLT